MRIVERRAYRGPNRYARFAVVRFTVDLEELEERPTTSLPGFVERLLRLVPTLHEHGCSYRTVGGFVRRMHEGTWMGHVLEHLAIALQNLGGQDVSFGRTRGTGEPGQYHVVFSVRDPELGLLAGDAAFALLQHVLRGHADEDARRVIADFVADARARALGPSTAALAAAASARGIPWRRTGDDSLLELGYGRYVARVWGTLTSRTSTIAADIASNKARTRNILAAAGIPTTEQRAVRDVRAALQAARELGFPVVIKPRNGNHGRAVAFIDEEDADEVARAYVAARSISLVVVVERFVAGNDYRLLVVDGRMIAAAHRVPAHVVGDGTHTVAELVDIVNADPRRGEGHEAVLTRLRLDDAAVRELSRNGLAPDDVPERGRAVTLCRTANLSTGGTAIDVTDRVHPDHRRAAERAARLVGLDVAGIDFLAPDIAQSDGRAAICEVNAGPGLRMHLAPSRGRPRDVAGPIIDALYPPGRPHAIPIAAITGTNGKTTTVRMLARICEQAFDVVGFTTTDGVYIGGELVFAGDMTGPRGASIVVQDPRVDVAVLEVARGGILKRGMGVPYCDVGAVTNVDADHIGLDGVRDVDELARVKRVVVEVARDTAVLNADDLRVRAMAEHCRAHSVCFVSEHVEDPFVRARIESGERVVTVDTIGNAAFVVAHRDGITTPVIAAADIPASLGGIARHNVVNAAFATAMALALRIPLPAIRRALTAFENDFDTTPGRLNVFDGHPFRVVLDYAHNAAGYRRIGATLGRLSVSGRRIAVVGMAGDRRDEDFAAAARVLANAFDVFICRGETDPRGREPGEPPRVMARALVSAGVEASRVSVEPDEVTAVRAALQMAQPGDLVAIFGVDLRATWDLVREHASEPVRATAG